MDQKRLDKACGDLDTPAVTILLDRLEANIARVQAHGRRSRQANRPHIKTHKIPAIGKMQIAAGAVGITCQKLGEAEVFIDAGVADDILLTFNIVGAAKTDRLMDLSERVKRLAVVADNETVVRGLSEAGGEPRPRRAGADRMRYAASAATACSRRRRRSSSRGSPNTAAASPSRG